MDSKKIVAAVIIAIAATGFVLGFWIFWKPNNDPVNIPAATTPRVAEKAKSETENTAGTNFPKATGKADDIASGLASQIASEEEKFSGEESDAGSLGTDSNTLNDFGQSYDSNEF